jgi:hypothetical protein
MDQRLKNVLKSSHFYYFYYYFCYVVVSIRIGRKEKKKYLSWCPQYGAFHSLGPMLYLEELL